MLLNINFYNTRQECRLLMARWIVEAFDLGTECYKGDMGTHVISENIWLAHLFKCNLKSKGS